MAAVPTTVGEVSVEAVMERVWPGMDTHRDTRALLQAASARLGRPIVGVARGGASDASHFASQIPLYCGRAGASRRRGAHPGGFVLASSLRERAEVALAVARAALAG